MTAPAEEPQGLTDQAAGWVRQNMPAGLWRLKERDKATAAFRAGWWAAVRTFADDPEDTR